MLSLRRIILSSIAIALLLVAPFSAWALDEGDVASPEILFWIVIVIVTLFWVLILRFLFAHLKGKWEISEALSEEAVLPAGSPPPAEGKKPPMVASSSRLISTIGMVIMSAFFLGLSYYALWALFFQQATEPIWEVGRLLLVGATLFAPYAVNKLSEIFK